MSPCVDRVIRTLIRLRDNGGLMRSGDVRALAFIFFMSVIGETLAQTQEQLVAGAKREVALVVYASATAQQMQMYFAAFNKKYPFIKTEFFRTGKQKLVGKILFEEQAKQHLAAVIHTSVIEINIIKKRGGLSRYVPHEARGFASQYKDAEGFWTSAYPSGTLLG